MVFTVVKKLINTGTYCSTLLIPRFFINSLKKKGKEFEEVSMEFYEDYIVIKPVFTKINKKNDKKKQVNKK